MFSVIMLRSITFYSILAYGHRVCNILLIKIKPIIFFNYYCPIAFNRISSLLIFKRFQTNTNMDHLCVIKSTVYVYYAHALRALDKRSRTSAYTRARCIADAVTPHGATVRSTFSNNNKKSPPTTQ